MKTEGLKEGFVSRFYLLYRMGRFGFSAGLLFLFLSLYSLGKFPFNRDSIFIFTVYSVISLFSLLSSKKPTLLEFLLDELFIFVLVIDKIFSYGFFSIFLLFPVFFSVLFLSASSGAVVTVMAVVYQFFYFVYTGKTINMAVQFFLVSGAYVAMMLAALKLKHRLKNQEIYIKALEEEKERSLAYKKLYEISADLAHELKNPLASIKGAVELLKEGRNSPRLVSIIYRETLKLDRIVRDFLNLARPPSAEVSKIKISDVLREILKSLEHYGKKCEVSFEDLDVYVEADARGFYSALENIIRNAFQWAKSNVLVTCRRVGDKIEITVEDDGPGVAEREKEKIFEPFYSRRPDGSGLGLPIAKKFAMEQGGSLEVGKSSLGGAKFTLVIPVKRGKDESADS